MKPPENVEIEVHLEDAGTVDTMARDVREGLTARPKHLPSKYFYDERGSRLFEHITELPEYYLTRAELALLRRRAPEIARRTRFQELVELGSGAATKSRELIDAGLAEGSLRRYVPVDLSLEIAERAAHEVAEAYPDLAVHAVVGDFEKHLGKVPDGERRLAAFLGSTLGNFSRDDAVAFLRKVVRLLSPDDAFVLGTDLVKDRATLEAAYNDSQGVTAEFNRNILRVINRHLGGEFDPSRFEHVSYYNPARQRIETYLRSRSDQTVTIGDLDLDVPFARDEMMRTEVSCKYTRDSVEAILDAAGLTLIDWFEDDERTFALSLSRLSRESRADA